MKASLSDARLDRYAGQFVWLEIDFDKTMNRSFLTQHGVSFTPTLFVLDPRDGRTLATQLGGLTVPELTAFLERGAHLLKAGGATPADQALARGDALLGKGKAAEAAAAYRDAVRSGSAAWPDRDRAVASWIWALSAAGDRETCATTAAAEAPRMKRDDRFVRAVLAGLQCAKTDGPLRSSLERLAAEAADVPSALRDHRFQIYQQLMAGAKDRGDRAALERWGERWLRELDAAKPAGDDERSALDIARVDAASLLDEPSRVLPALIESERAMPGNYNASLRLAQMFEEAHRYDEAIAACDRGLLHATGPLARSWLLRTKGVVLLEKGDRASARPVLEEALKFAREIVTANARERNVEWITKKLKEI